MLKARQDNIDFLRAVAILAVLTFHYTTRISEVYGVVTPFKFPLGAYGVDLFFAVSGFCIFMTMERSTPWEHFFARRFARIQPAYMAAILVTWAVTTLAGMKHISLAVALSNMIWLNAIPNWQMVDGAYWSLIVELKFYLWVGLLYGLPGRHLSLKWAAFSVVGVAAALFASLTLSDGILIGSFAPGFLVGILAWEWDRLSNVERVPLAVVTAVLLALTPRFHAAPFVGVIVGAIGFTILRWNHLRVWRPITRIGLISYSLYLLHQNIGYAMILHLGGLPYWLRFLATASVVIGLAALFFHFIEKPPEKWVVQRSQRLFGRCRGVLRIPYRKIPHPTLAEEMRAW